MVRYRMRRRGLAFHEPPRFGWHVGHRLRAARNPLTPPRAQFHRTRRPPQARAALTEEEVLMARSAGARYECEECGAVLVYEKPCPCTAANEHAEVCCDKPMKQLVEAK